MKLQIFPCLELKTSPQVERIVNRILQEDDHLKLAYFLTTFNPDKDIDQIDIGHWIKVIEKFDVLLEKYRNVVLDHEGPPEEYFLAKQVVVSVLLFLSRLVQTAKDKKYFQSFEVCNACPLLSSSCYLRVFPLTG
jgi:hypothetical protein